MEKSLFPFSLYRNNKKIIFYKKLCINSVKITKLLLKFILHYLSLNNFFKLYHEIEQKRNEQELCSTEYLCPLSFLFIIIYGIS